VSGLTDAQLERYARHVILDAVGEAGQVKLLSARVLVVGAGGLGAPLLLYLAGAGIGTIGIVDNDIVERSNLQRQVIYGEADLGAPKVAAARQRLVALNPDLRIEIHRENLQETNADRLVGAYDLIADGSDNFATRYLLNDACHRHGKTLVSAALWRFDGQLSTFKSHLGPPHPCYRCLFPTPPAEGLVPRCEEAGIFGAVAGVMGSLQAGEVIKEILDIGETLSGRLLIYDGQGTAFRSIAIKRNSDCSTCGATRARGNRQAG